MYTIGYSDEELYKENHNKNMIWKKGYKTPQEAYSAGIYYILKNFI
jgi:hypothetical protein